MNIIHCKRLDGAQKIGRVAVRLVSPRSTLQGSESTIFVLLPPTLVHGCGIVGWIATASVALHIGFETDDVMKPCRCEVYTRA